MSFSVDEDEWVSFGPSLDLYVMCRTSIWKDLGAEEWKLESQGYIKLGQDTQVI